MLFFVTFFGCGGETSLVPPIENKPKVDKTAFIASLLTGFKYWRFEELTVERPDSVRTINLKAGSINSIPGMSHVDVLNFGYGFRSKGEFTVDIVDSGPFGNIPYAAKDTISIFIAESGFPYYIGTWHWDEERETVAVKDPISQFAKFIKALSKKPTSPEVGYLDNTMPPKYRTSKQAILGSSPDRIRIVFYDNDPVVGETKYIFTMRAACATREISSWKREFSYETTY